MITALPLPQTPDPATAPTLRWGVCGPGDIAHSFTSALQTYSSQQVVAVASRSPQRARTFAEHYSIPNVHVGYEALVADPNVDIVYVSVPDAFHKEVALLAIGAGKHVLVEKPLATNAADARELSAAARAAGVFMMEGMWARYLPQASILDQLVRGGDVGSIRGVEASFGFSVPYDPAAWMWDPSVGGGALLAFGIYPIAYAAMVFGDSVPEGVAARGLLAADGLDVHAAALVDYGDACATVTVSMLCATPITATVYGSRGFVAMDETFVIPSGLQFAQAGGERLTWRDQSGITDRGGLSYEAAAAASYIAQGRTESPLYTLDATVQTIETIDMIKRQLVAQDRIWRDS